MIRINNQQRALTLKSNTSQTSLQVVMLKMSFNAIINLKHVNEYNLTITGKYHTR